MANYDDELLHIAKMTAGFSLFGPVGTIGGLILGSVPLVSKAGRMQALNKLTWMQNQIGYNDYNNRFANRFREREMWKQTKSRWSPPSGTTLKDEIAYIKLAIPVRIAEWQFSQDYGNKIGSIYSPCYFNCKFILENDPETFYKEGFDNYMYLLHEGPPRPPVKEEPPKCEKSKEPVKRDWATIVFVAISTMVLIALFSGGGY